MAEEGAEACCSPS